MKKEFDMSVLAIPRYTVTLPSTGEKIQLRTMLTKEHKALLIANESDDKIDAIEQCLENCIVSDIDMKDLTVGDAEYLFIQMYINSNGVDTIQAKYNCCAPKLEEENKSDETETELELDPDDIFNKIVAQSDEEALKEMLTPTTTGLCGTEILVDIDLSKTFVPEFKGDNLIKANENVVIKLKHPTIQVFENNDPSKAEELFNIAVECIDEIHVNDTVFTKSELKEQNKLVPILGELDTKTYKKIVDFIDNVPRITTYVDVICPVCGNKEKVTLKGIEDFFI